MKARIAAILCVLVVPPFIGIVDRYQTRVAAQQPNPIPGNIRTQETVPASTVNPVLTDVQKKDLQIASQALELWQLRVQMANGELQKAQETMGKLVASLTPPGYQMTNDMQLVKTPELPKKP